MRNSMKSKLYENTTALIDEVDYLRSNGKEVSSLERASEVGNIGILYFESLDDKEVEMILSVIELALKQANNLKVDVISIDAESLDRIVDDVEDLYRSKKFLLDKSEEKSVSYAA